ncbi:hypothetical protein BJY52DRAFT_1115176, partial [Lactarius psammicola]
PSEASVRTELDRVTVPDEVTMQLAGPFADEHKSLAQLECSTTIVPVYEVSADS